MPQNEHFTEIEGAGITETDTRVEENSLEMEELESRIAPNTVWGD
jgi:hypothetical protein